MKTKTFRQKLMSKAWVLGFLGFLGLLGLVNSKSSFAFIFFGLFSFFSFYWDSKIDFGIVDERLLKNQYRASSTAFTIAFIIIWFAAVILNTGLVNLFPFINSLQAKYNCLLIAIAFSYAIGMNLNSYLVYYYETKE